MQSLGNDFVVIDGVRQSVVMSPAIAHSIADRHTGIGCDQILIAEAAKQVNGVDFNFRIFNADGSEVGQCGNGARCFAQFLHDENLSNSDTITVQTHTGVMQLRHNGNSTISVNMGVPTFEPDEIPMKVDKRQNMYTLDVNGESIEVCALAIGNPHAVQIIDNVDTADVPNKGALIENHSFFPRRVNAGYMQILAKDAIRLRVYERGVGETLACGSGACAAAAAGYILGHLGQSVNVSLPGGDLQVEWEGETKPIWLTGLSSTVFEGSIKLEQE